MTRQARKLNNVIITIILGNITLSACLPSAANLTNEVQIEKISDPLQQVNEVFMQCIMDNKRNLIIEDIDCEALFKELSNFFEDLGLLQSTCKRSSDFNKISAKLLTNAFQETLKSVSDLQKQEKNFHLFLDQLFDNLSGHSVQAYRKFYNTVDVWSKKNVPSMQNAMMELIRGGNRLVIYSTFQIASRQKSSYSFLNELFDNLSDNSEQASRNFFNVGDVCDWSLEEIQFFELAMMEFFSRLSWSTEHLKRTAKNGIYIDENNFKAFVGKTNSHLVEVKHLIPSDAQLASLNHVLSLTLKHELTIICREDVITLKGNFVLFSDFLFIGNNKLERCDWRNKTLNIFALNTVFVDWNLRAIGDRLKLNIIAPRWVVIGNRKIELDGVSGRNAYRYPWISADGKSARGLPGDPGGPGGVFFGMGNEFVNSENLKISANGGNGGDARECGEGGLGGDSGKIKLFSLSAPSKPVRSSITFAKGAVGKRGSSFAVLYISWFNYKNFTCVFAKARQPDKLVIHSDENEIFTNFISFLIKNWTERYGRFFAKQFVEKLQNIGEFNLDFNTLGLINHLDMLSSYAQINNMNYLIPFYESLLQNIERYAANPKSSESSNEYKKVLSFLYTATLTKMSNLKRNTDSDLIIDIGGYLDMVSQNVKTLSALQDERQLVTVVESLKSSFKKEIDQKIVEANSLITTTVAPEFSKISSRFDKEISGLVRETIALQNAAKEEKTALQAKKKELESSMWNGIFGKILNVFSKIFSFLGPVGAAVGTAIEIGTTVASSLRQGETQGLPSLESGGLTSKLEGFGNAMLDLSVSIRVNKNDIREVTQGIENMEKKIKELENFEKKIYDKLVPMIRKMGNDLIKTAKELHSKSSVSLDVIGWQVQNIIRDTSVEIQQFTRGFEVHESVARSIEKLEEVMTTLIKVYDRIQEFQEQQRLATYMAELSLASTKQIVVSNPLLSKRFRDLQISIRSNILLNQYNSVLNAFKQWIFPFADFFLKDFQLPEHLVSSNTDIETLATTAASRIEVMRLKIQKYKTSIEDFDKHIFVAQFNGSSAVMKPFYVWKNSEHSETIAKLLAGESVLLRADITKSAVGKDAIKFNFVEFGLKSVDPMVQAEIDKKLLNYVVSMTHLGNSHYRYCGEYFSIASSSQSMLYSVEKGTIQNNVYKKLLLGDIMLSPYAFWELRLSLNPFKPMKSAVSLESFADKVDLVLEGSGSFVNTPDNKFDVASYYKVDDSIKLLLN